MKNLPAKLFLVATVLILTGCRVYNEEWSPDSNYMVYDNGSGEIGSAGGVVKVTESSSPLNGVSVKIPDGALDKNVKIEVEEGTNPYQDGRVFVNFKPNGLKFTEPVQITLPFDSKIHKDSVAVYYWDEENNQTIEIWNEKVTSNSITASTTHFSNYSADKKYVYANIGKSNGVIAASGMLTSFSKIPIVLMSPERSWPNRVNAEHLIKNNSFGNALTVKITYVLYEQGFIFSTSLAETEILLRLSHLSPSKCPIIFVYKTNKTIDKNLIYGENDVEKIALICVPTMDDFYNLLGNGNIYRGIFKESTFKNPEESLKGKKLFASVGFTVGNWEFGSSGKFLKHTETIWGHSDYYDINDQNSYYIGDDNQNGVHDDFENLNKPEIEIISPKNNSIYSVYDEIKLQCTATDKEDGKLTNSQIKWSYSTEIETYYFENGTITQLPAGSYVFKATATDSDGNTSESTVKFTVKPDSYPPTATIKLPEGDLSGDIKFEYTISDADGNANDLFVVIRGININNPTLKDFSNGDYDGNYIRNVEPGTHSFVWDSKADFPDKSGTVTISIGYLNEGNRKNISDYYEFEFDNKADTNGDIEYGTFTDSRDNKTYKTVKIGNQIWMAENLAYDIGNGCWAYNNDKSNVATYGRLYNWSAAKSACPSGWHLPADAEWKELEMVIGMSQSEADDTGWRGTNEGKKLKATTGWNNNGNDTDDYGFSALPGGFRYSNGSFGNVGGGGYWWSATEHNSSHAWGRYLAYSSSGVRRTNYYEKDGFSVRCVRD